IDDADVRELLASTLEFEVVVLPIRPSIWTQRIQRPLGFKEQLLVAEPPCAEFGGFERSLHSSQEAFKLCKQVLMFLARPLNRLSCGQAEQVASGFERLSCQTAMKDRVPNQIRVQNGPHVVARGFFGYPSLDPKTVQLNGFISVGLLPGPVLIKEICYIFDHFIPNLHPHALLGNGAQ